MTVNVERLRVERVVTSGFFELDGGRWEVDNNVWLVGDDDECLVVDAAHDAEAIAEAVAGRRVVAVVCTHAHSDHVNSAPALAGLVGAPVLLHPADRALWNAVHPASPPDGELADGLVLTVGGAELRTLHTPGHSPGGCCLYAPSLGAVFSGDTLFSGGPGATGRSFSDLPTIISSIEARLLALPPATVVHAGHGPSTTIGDEAPHLHEWVARGY